MPRPLKGHRYISAEKFYAIHKNPRPSMHLLDIRYLLTKNMTDIFFLKIRKTVVQHFEQRKKYDIKIFN
jgi:hypothetical protein